MKWNQIFRLAPEIWKYQLFTKLLLAPLFAAIVFGGINLHDFPVRTWRGFLIILLCLALLSFYVAMDLGVKILYAGNVVDGVTRPLFRNMILALAALPKYGVGILLYITLLTPVLGIGLGVTVAEALDMLAFDAVKSPLYHIVYAVLTLIFLSLGVTHIFCLHGVLLDRLSVREARTRARALLRERWKDFLRKQISCGLSLCAFLFLSVTLFFIAPLSLGARFFPVNAARSLMILTLFLNAVLFAALGLLLTPCCVIDITKLYREYSMGGRVVIPDRAVRKHPFLMVLVLLYLLEVAALFSQTTYSFDSLFPPKAATRIVAHRGGGNENAENTLSGLETAIALGAYGSEIDVQRTLDGYYVINHDADFSRMTGDYRMLKEMTLEEIKQLPYPVPTLEEVLDRAKGRILLFVELKGDTADWRMCNEIVGMIRERDMMNQAVLLSFKYDLIAYIERRWPEIRTGYLDFSLSGRAEALPCDYLGLEEVSVTPETVRAVHDCGKRLLVWTPNAPEAQERFLLSDADAMITDDVARALEIRDCLNHERDFRRILSAFGWR